MLLALTATMALVVLLLALIHSAGVHALAILAGLAIFDALKSIAAPLALSGLGSVLVMLAVSTAVRHLVRSQHASVRILAHAAISLTAGYAGYAIAGEVARFAGSAPWERVLLGIAAGSFLAMSAIRIPRVTIGQGREADP